MSDEYLEEGFEEEETVDEEKNYEEILTKKGMTFMTKSVLFSIGLIILYTIWTQIAVIVWHIEPNDTLTEWIYKFFGLEITLMCLKKITDKRLLKKKYKK